MKYSLVIPIKNEEDNIRDLVSEIEPVMIGLRQSWELLFIDDGSTDRSLSVLQSLCKQKPYIRILSFTRNFGQSAAFAAGFQAAKGDLIITLDGDGQNDPADIPKLTAAITDCDLVVGWRVQRQDTLQKKVISRFSNWIRSRLCRDGIHDTGCSLKVYRRESLLSIKMYQGMHRFLPALFQIEGYQVKEIPITHRERSKGATKYTLLNRLWGPIMDMMVVCWMRRRSLHHKIREEITHETLSRNTPSTS